jgi:glutaminyl-peptide cyclotransferase
MSLPRLGRPGSGPPQPGRRRSPRPIGHRLALSLLGSLLALGAWAAPLLEWQRVADYPHRSLAFTQGLELYGDALLESSGRYGHSFLARWQLDSEEVERSRLPRRYFAEGLTRIGQRLFLLTWQHERGFVLNADTFKPLGSFRYQGEGWGLTNDGARLIMSDGSDTLRFLDPDDFSVLRRLPVHDNEIPVEQLNELEWIPAGVLAPQPRLLANIWRSDRIVVIDPVSGALTGELDLTELYPERPAGVDVLNGIAYDPGDATLLVTGKWWPRIYRLRVAAEAVPPPP